MKKCTFFLLFASLFVTSIAVATSEKLYPKGCTPETTQFQQNTLYLGTTPGKEQNRVFVIKNSSSEMVMVTQAPEQNELADHFNAVITPDTWSAIVTEQDNFKMQCYEANNPQRWPLDCSQVINACELRVAPIMQSARGQYWITKNQNSQSALFSELRANGIFP